MKINITYKRIAFAALIIFMLTFLLCGCTGNRIQNYKLSGETIKSPSDLSFSSTKMKDDKNNLIASSGMTALYYSPKTASPVIQNQNTIWRSLPREVNEKSGEIPAVLTLEVMNEGQCYVLNSQTDCVKAKTHKMTKNENGFSVEYLFSVGDSQKPAQIAVPVNFYLEDGSFFVSVNCNNIVCGDGYIITNLSLMNYFGCDSEASQGDYILVPDNSGAIIDTYNAGEDFGGVSFKVYGDTEKNNSLVGVYGFKKKTSAFVTMIEKGDAIATINADVSSHCGYNRVGADFEITQTMTNEEKDRIYISGESYSGEIRLCYRFVSGNSADYSGMAIACREHLIRTGVLSADTVEETGDLPFVLSTVGEAVSPLGKVRTLTSYEQLLDMLTYLKGKGFPNIAVRYKGTLTGGTNQVAISKCSLLTSLGSQQQLKELQDYMSAQRMKLYFDLGFTSCAPSSVKSAELAKDLTGGQYSLCTTNLLGAESKSALASFDKIEENIIDIFALTKKSSISNISVSDASAFLYCDPFNGATRADVADMIKSESMSLTTIGDLMTEKGNFYMIKNVSVISSLPLTASYRESACYKSVPFIPLLLHAITQYSCEPINLSSDSQKSMLRCVEYGALPQFEWCYEELEEESFKDLDEAEPNGEEKEAQQENEVSPYSYSDWATSAYAFYEKANRAFGDIMDSRMTAHYEVQQGVYCTEYGETSIYVNYTNSDVTIGGVTISANDFMRVN